MRRIVAGLLFLSAALADDTVFPGEVKELRAPAGGLVLSYNDPGTNEFGGHDYSLWLQYPDGRAEGIVDFTRQVRVAWSPSGTALAVTNMIGTDTADCYVIIPGTKTQKISLTDIVLAGRFPVPAWALQHSAHGAVTCDGWAAPDQLRFVLEGAGGDSPNGFRYSFTYDLTSATAKQTGGAAKTGKRTPKKKR